ncbi:MAG: gluconate 2-dehydrogenase subunit 3 family protein [Gemmatimonadaceae bacterium]|nr:gluconate 2-dehydrogenase subunit 3 family protein [Gemmatimonadaceae bacterium]
MNDDREPPRPTGDSTGSADAGDSTSEVERHVPSHPLKRRELLKAIAAGALALPLAGSLAACNSDSRSLPVVDAPARRAGALDANGEPVAGPRGTPSDPDLLNPVITWTMQLTAAELVTLTALCDMIIPADDTSPAASAVGVPAYINEYVSAPSDWYQKALVQVRGGLVWIDVESNRRFGAAFAALTDAQRTAICDDICYVPRAKPEFRQAAQFFDRVRDLTAEGFYTTDEGMKDIGYVGNVALASFDGPPPEVLKHLGLA